MNLEQVTQLLTLAAQVDNRSVDIPTIRVWHEIIPANIEYQDAQQALLEHFREQPDTYLMPGHIVARARVIRSARLELLSLEREALERGPELPPPRFAYVGSTDRPWREPAFSRWAKRAHPVAADVPETEQRTPPDPAALGFCPGCAAAFDASDPRRYTLAGDCRRHEQS